MSEPTEVEQPPGVMHPIDGFAEGDRVSFNGKARTVSSVELDEASGLTTLTFTSLRGHAPSFAGSAGTHLARLDD